MGGGTTPREVTQGPQRGELLTPEVLHSAQGRAPLSPPDLGWGAARAPGEAGAL